jgi:hypothetical protein
MSSPYHQPLCSVCLKPLTVSWPQQKHVCNAIPVGPVLTCIPSEELDRLRALTQQQAEQIAELQNTLSHRDYWYGCRSARLFDWAHEKLPDDLRHEYFSIVANGTIGLEEPPTYAQQFNRMKYRAEEADKTVADLVEYAKGLRKALLHITSNTTPEGAGQRLLWIEAESALAKPMPKVMKEDS